MFDPASTKPKDRTMPAILLLAAIALAGIWSLLPNAEEKAAGLLDDARYPEAMAVLEETQAHGMLSSYESQMLLKTYVLTKKRLSAAWLLVNEPTLQSASPEVIRQVLALFRDARDYSGEAQVLRAEYDRNGDEQDLARLRVLYRLLSDKDGEASLLEAAIAKGGSNPAYEQRLHFLRTELGGDNMALWVAPSGAFSQLLEAAPVRSLAFSNLTPPF
ncbi:hypothetical protein [Devosia rhizoryzae]|uniref:Tetratricopeptide repeat protein n=1 Tax=Devosia rhizoryzae TaxID=2774137 RepID=A0ABX7CCR4_9HYPH|nr:hypothetical protein [Devosia rhizoryzae]QQR40405.1 hypothetical protein JI748_05210 [Devosia rhizoryzae]